MVCTRLCAIIWRHIRCAPCVACFAKALTVPCMHGLRCKSWYGCVKTSRAALLAITPFSVTCSIETWWPSLRGVATFRISATLVLVSSPYLSTHCKSCRVRLRTDGAGTALDAGIVEANGRVSLGTPSNGETRHVADSGLSLSCYGRHAL